MNTFRKGLDCILDYLIYFLMFVMTLTTSAQVFWRYVFNDPIAWSEELARYTFVWLVFLGSCVAFRDGKHMAVDLIPPFLPPGLKKVQEVIVKVIMAGFFIAVVIVSPEILGITLDQPSASLSIPIAFVYAAFPLSAVIMLVYLIMDIASCRKEG